MNRFATIVVPTAATIYGGYSGWLMFGQGSFLGRQGGAFLGGLMGGLLGIAWGLILVRWGRHLNRVELLGALGGALWLALHMLLVNGNGGALIGLLLGSITGKELAQPSNNSQRTLPVVRLVALLALLEGLLVAGLLVVLRWFG